MKRSLSLILSIIILASLFASCDDAPDIVDASSDVISEAVSDIGSDSAESDTESDEPAEDVCPLPDIKWNTTLKWASHYPNEKKDDVRYFEIWCDEELGDTISKTVLSRSRWLEDTYGITIEMIWNPDVGAAKFAENASQSNIELDAICAPVFDLAPLLQNGFFYDIAQINNEYNDGNGWINLDAPYWDQNAVRDYSIANRVFMLTGDAVLYDDESTWAIFFNKDMVEEYGYEDPYKTVRDGNWTIDYLYSVCREVTKPDGDKLTWDADAGHTWGLVSQNVDCMMFMMGCGQKMITKDANDLPVMRIAEQRNVDIAQKVVSMMIDGNAVGVADFFGRWNSGVYGVEVDIFTNGHAMFMPQQMSKLNSSGMKSTDFEIGVLPMPKADELQDEYSSSANVYYLQMMAIPTVNVEKLEATLFAFEAMAWYGRKYVKPEYYEKVLKLQKFRDESAEEMLDLIFGNRTFDMGIAYNWDDMIQFYNLLLKGKTTDIISKYDTKSTAFQAAIDAAIAVFTK